MKVVAMIVKPSIGSLKWAKTTLLRATLTSSSAGFVKMTVGAVKSPVMKFHV